MVKIQRLLRMLLFVAASCLVANDLARLVMSFDQQAFASQAAGTEEESNPIGAASLFEEEVKHKEVSPLAALEIVAEEGLEASVAHLIKDDEVRHLAYLAVFSPPPDLA